jgi:glycosyltransferase involved in cell wall biosynthesis
VVPILFKGTVSVIIPNHNYARYLGQAIDSVLNQTYENVEIIVVNNGSTDNSMSVLSEYLGKIKLVDQSNLGQSGARNSGLKASSGEFIAFLDADDYWEKEKLKKQTNLLKPDTQLVYSGISSFSDTNLEVNSTLLPKVRGECSSFFAQLPGESIVLSGESTAVFSRELYLKVGEFDRSLNSAAGWDFFRRCSKFTKFDFVDEALTNYRIHNSNMSKSSRNTIPDIRRAYSKLLGDDYWQLTAIERQEIVKFMESSYFKTYLKEREWKLAYFSAKEYLRLIAKSS